MKLNKLFKAVWKYRKYWGPIVIEIVKPLIKDVIKPLINKLKKDG